MIIVEWVFPTRDISLKTLQFTCFPHYWCLHYHCNTVQKYNLGRKTKSCFTMNGRVHFDQWENIPVLYLFIELLTDLCTKICLKLIQLWPFGKGNEKESSPVGILFCQVTKFPQTLIRAMLNTHDPTLQQTVN